LIESEWVVCVFGGPEWWTESNRIGNAQVEAGCIGVRNQPREAKVLGGLRGTEAIRQQGAGIYGLTREERVENGKKGGAVTASLGYLDYGSDNSIKTFESLSKGGKIGGEVTRDSGKLLDASRLGGAVQGPRNKGMAWYHRYDNEGNIVRKRSKTPLPPPWIAGKGKSK
jgi:general stress protein YciG